MAVVPESVVVVVVTGGDKSSEDEEGRETARESSAAVGVIGVAGAVRGVGGFFFCLEGVNG